MVTQVRRSLRRISAFTAAASATKSHAILTHHFRTSRRLSLRTLSSAQTWWIKYFIPSTFALSMSAGGLWFFLFDRPPVLSAVTGVWSLEALYCVAIGLLTFLVAWQGLPLKRVRMDDEALYVSNLFREIRIPLSEMQHVSEFLGWRQGNRVTITLRSNTPLGRNVVFLPRSSRPGRADPIVKELRALIHN